jgi:hypothetical protein
LRRRESNVYKNNRLADIGEFVSVKRRPQFIARKFPGTHFCEWLSPYSRWKDYINRKIQLRNGDSNPRPYEGYLNLDFHTNQLILV